MRSAMVWLLVAASAGCRPLAPAPRESPSSATSEPIARPGQRPSDVRSAAYALFWQGDRVGEARERLTASRFVRRERVAIRRGDAVVELGTEIDIELGPALAARRVLVTRTGGGQRVTGRAVRRGSRWLVIDDIRDPDERPRSLEGDAVPVELVPWMLAANELAPRHGASPLQIRVLLSGHGFATADLSIRPLQNAPNRMLATMALADGSIASEIQLDQGGAPIAVLSDGGLESRRVDADELYRDFDPPELVDAASIAVRGASRNSSRVRLVIDGVTAALPPALPGQLVRAEGDTWTITLSANLRESHVVRVPGGGGPSAREAADWQRDLAQRVVYDADARSPMDEIRALVNYADRALENDLGTTAVDARAALSAGRGDCRAHAALFAALAAARGFDVALVTGYRLMDQPSRLTRHRWVLVRLGHGWLAVDPTYGEVPAAPRLLGLAIHDAAGGLSLADEVAFAGFADAAARAE